MKMGVYSVFDKAVGAYIKPFYVRSRAEAIRSFADAVNDPKLELGKHALDYVLMYHGEFDDVAGVFNSVEPERVISATECLGDASTTSH